MLRRQQYVANIQHQLEAAADAAATMSGRWLDALWRGRTVYGDVTIRRS